MTWLVTKLAQNPANKKATHARTGKLLACKTMEPATSTFCLGGNSTWKAMRGKANHDRKESKMLHGVGINASPSLLQNWFKLASMQTQGMPLALAAISAAR